MDNKRTISNVYVVQIIHDGGIVKICSSRELAEYYRKLLTPKYIEAFDLSLTIEEYPLVHFKTETIKIGEHEYINVIQENLEALEKLNNIKELLLK